MGNKIILRDVYPYTLPDEPTDERLIINHDKPKKDQYWTRQPLPDFRRLSLPQKTAFIEEEWRRLQHGVHIMINGELVWLTPSHYDFLQYANIPDFGIPRYYASQRIDFYFKDFIRYDPNCYGELTIKPRRYGYTGMTISETLHYVIDDYGRSLGLMSTDYIKCRDSLFRPMRDSFLTRPKYCRPDLYMPNGRPPEAEMRFRSNTITERDEMMLDTEQGLGSKVVPKSTTASGFDGEKWREVIMDELYKWTEADVYQTWRTTKETLAVGGIVRGKGHLFATMGDNKTMENAVRDGIRLWGESNYHERNRYGMTVSGLYRWFVPAYVAFEMFIDKYGNCNESLAKEYLMEDRKNYEEGTQDYIYHVRKFPFTAEEAMASVENTTMFSSMRINERLAKIYIMHRTEKPYTVGMFQQDNFTDQVKYVPDPKGYWKVSKVGHPSPANKNPCRKINGLVLPPLNPEGVIGNDPVRTADNVSGHISMNGTLVYKKFDYYNTGVSNRLIGQLFGRDDDADVMNEQVALASLYWGYPVMTERQVTSCYDFFRLNGMIKMLLNSEYDKATGLWMKPAVMNDGIELIQGLIKAPKKGPDGIALEPDLLDSIDFEETLQQIKDFSKANSTKFDLVMALICAAIGAKQIKYTILNPVQNERRLRALRALHPSRK